MTERTLAQYQSIIHEAADNAARAEIEERIFRAIMEHQKFFAAAFIAETGLRPSQCEMVIQGCTIHFRMRPPAADQLFSRRAPIDPMSLGGNHA